MPDPFEFPPRGRRDDPLAEVERIFDQVREQFAKRGGRSRFNPWLVVAILLLVYAASGIYIVAPDERGIVGSSRVDLQACKLEYSIVSPK